MTTRPPDAPQGAQPQAAPLAQRIRMWADRLEDEGADDDVLAAVRCAADMAAQTQKLKDRLAQRWRERGELDAPLTAGRLPARRPAGGGTRLARAGHP
jgi:hypothetical protein